MYFRMETMRSPAQRELIYTTAVRELLVEVDSAVTSEADLLLSIERVVRSSDLPAFQELVRLDSDIAILTNLQQLYARLLATPGHILR